MSKQEYIQFSALAGGSSSTSFRTAEYKGSQHLIVPVVALIGDAIIWPMGALCYELVPARVLSENVEQWNGRPVLPDHPDSIAGANQPSILESQQFGHIFNSKWSNNRLTMEAWLDLATSNPDARSVISSCQSGEIVEVSIGAWVTIEPQSGYLNGREYGAVWKSIRSDHLAVGLSGNPGACSVEMGCGTRFARQVIGETMKREAQKETFRDLRTKDLSGLSSNDLSSLLQSALYEIEPSAIYLWVADFDDTEVIYSMTVEERGQSTFYSRSYAVVDGDKVTLGSTSKEMTQRTVYEPKAAKLAKSKGGNGTMNPTEKKSLLSAMFERLRSAVFGSNLDAEEAAELIGYQTLSTLFDQMSASLTSAKSTVADLIKAELVETSNILEESAEETLETAQIGSIETMCIAMYGTLNSVMDLCYQLRYPSDPSSSISMYKDGKPLPVDRSLAGARHSAGDVKIIQDLHDKSVTLGASCDKMAEMSDGTKQAAAGDNPPCGCHKKLSEGGTEADTPTPEPSEDETMAIEKETMKALVGRLLKGEGTDADRATLKAEYPDLEIPAVEARAAAKAEPATPTPQTEEEWLATAPDGVKRMLANAKAQEAQQRKALITYLSGAQKKLSAADLETRTLEQLTELYGILETVNTSHGSIDASTHNSPARSLVDFSGIGLPIDRSTSPDADAQKIYLNPPDPYEKSLAALRGETPKAN